MLRDKNIYLRGVEMEDLVLIENLENDPENWVHSGTLIPFSRKSIEEYILSIRDLNAVKQYRWIIGTTKEDESIGAIDIYEFDSIHRRAGIGIIINKNFRKNGYASDAIKLLCDYAFSHLNLHQLWANIIDSNIASQRLFEKNDFHKIASKPNWIISNGKWHDEFMYQRINPKSL
jgi:diamine N-acetyltransferase